jgi:hypothetical protein
MKNPCKACAEYCMGLCRDRVKYLEWYGSYCDRVKKQIKDVSRRGERGQEDIKAVHITKERTGDDRKEAR